MEHPELGMAAGISPYMISSGTFRELGGTLFSDPSNKDPTI